MNIYEMQVLSINRKGRKRGNNSMKFIIHYDGRYEDSIVIEGDDIEEIRERAFVEEESRGWKPENCWSEEIK